MISYIIFGISFAFAAAVQPGPLQTFIISQTMEKGWRPTLPVSFAPLISDIPIFLLVLFLLNTMPDNFVILLRFAGGLFLLYLGYSSFKTWQSFEEKQTKKSVSSHQTLINAVFVNLLNPAPYLGWSLILGPLFLEGWNIAPVNGIALICSFYLTMIITLMGIIVLFGFARKLGPNVSRHLIGISSIVLFIFGIYQIWQGLTSHFTT